MTELPITVIWRELVASYAEYVQELENECNGLIGLASAHGWRGTDEKIKRGAELRERITRLRSELPLG